MEEKKLLHVVVILSFLYINLAHAEVVDRAWIQGILKQKDEKREEAQALIAAVTGKKESKVCGGAQALDETTVEGRYPNLLVFVSFSMPMESLKLLGDQVQKAGGSLVFRGLVKDSFPLTAEKMRKLGTEAMIDPTLFEAFQVKGVPTFVMLSTPLQTLEQLPSYDQLTGHVSLKHALDTFQRGAR